MVRHDVTALTDERLGRINFLAGVIPGVCPNNANLNLRIHTLGSQGIGIDSLQNLRNRNSGDIASFPDLPLHRQVCPQGSAPHRNGHCKTSGWEQSCTPWHVQT